MAQSKAKAASMKASKMPRPMTSGGSSSSSSGGDFRGLSSGSAAPGRRTKLTGGRSLSIDLMGTFPNLEPDQTQDPTPVFSYNFDQLEVSVCAKSTSEECSCAFMYEGNSEFEAKLTKEWEKAVRNKVLNYSLNLMYKLLPGTYLFAAQLNVERGNLRRKPHSFRSLDDPFDSRRFNYHKIRRKEVLLDMRCADKAITSDPLDRHMVVVNASPIERNHCLVLPLIDACTSQRLTPQCIRLMVDCLLLSRNPNVIVVFNSLLAFASVNHQHFHILQWPYQTPMIRKPVAHVDCGVHALYAPLPWCVPAFVIQLTALSQVPAFVNRAPTLKVVEEVEAKREWDNRQLIVSGLGKHVPHYATMYIFPRKSVPGAKPMNKFSPAACELAGNLLVYNEQFFHHLRESDVLRIIGDEAGLPIGAFDTLVHGLRTHLSEAHRFHEYLKLHPETSNRERLNSCQNVPPPLKTQHSIRRPGDATPLEPFPLDGPLFLQASTADTTEDDEHADETEARVRSIKETIKETWGHNMTFGTFVEGLDRD